MIKVGQIWKDNDKRMSRYVCVESVGEKIAYRECRYDGTGCGFTCSLYKSKSGRFPKAFSLHADITDTEEK